MLDRGASETGGFELSMFGKNKRAIGSLLASVVLIFSATFAAFHSHTELHEHGISADEHHEAECSLCDLASGNDVALVAHESDPGEILPLLTHLAVGSTLSLFSDYLNPVHGRAPPA